MHTWGRLGYALGRQSMMIFARNKIIMFCHNGHDPTKEVKSAALSLNISLALPHAASAHQIIGPKSG